MQRNLHHLTNSLIRVWQDLTQGDLMIYWSVDCMPLEESGDLPQQVVDAVAEYTNLDAEPIAGATWWLLLAEQGKERSPSLVAKDVQGGPWGDLLHLSLIHI